MIYSSGFSLELLRRDTGLEEKFTFLAKPYTPAKLATVVRNCLEQEHHSTPAAASIGCW